MPFVLVSHGQKAVDPLKQMDRQRPAQGVEGSPTVRRPWTH